MKLVTPSIPLSHKQLIDDLIFDIKRDYLFQMKKSSYEYKNNKKLILNDNTTTTTSAVLSSTSTSSSSSSSISGVLDITSDNILNGNTTNGTQFFIYLF